MTLEERIENAFASLKPLDADEIVDCQCGECTSIVSHLAGMDWRDVTAVSVNGDTQKETICTLNAFGFRYYLPAFMLISLQENDIQGLAYVLIEVLTYSNERSADFANARLKVLNEEQREVIRLYIESWTNLYVTPAIVESVIWNLTHKRSKPYHQADVSRWSEEAVLRIKASKTTP
jgi:hypothetical protein